MLKSLYYFTCNLYVKQLTVSILQYNPDLMYRTFFKGRKINTIFPLFMLVLQITAGVGGSARVRAEGSGTGKRKSAERMR